MIGLRGSLSLGMIITFDFHADMILILIDHHPHFIFFTSWPLTKPNEVHGLANPCLTNITCISRKLKKPNSAKASFGDV